MVAESIERLEASTNAANRHRTYHASTPSSLLSRIQSALNKQQQQHNHRRIDVLRPTIGSNHQPLLPSHATTKRWHGGPLVDHDHAGSIHVSFVDVDGNPVKADVDAYVGESLLQVAQRNDIELEGACEGVCACSTCHVIFPDEDVFDNILEEASEDEEDMLDMAFGLTETSRLSCQVIVTDEMDGMEIEIPAATRNFYVDGHVPKPH